MQIMLHNSTSLPTTIVAQRIMKHIKTKHWCHIFNDFIEIHTNYASFQLINLTLNCRENAEIHKTGHTEKADTCRRERD